MKARKPAVLACGALILSLAILGFAWQWSRWESEWIRENSVPLLETEGPLGMIAWKVEDVAADDPRFAEFNKTAFTAIEGPSRVMPWPNRQGCRRWPRTFPWCAYCTSIRKGGLDEKKLTDMARQIESALANTPMTFRWHLAVIDSDGIVHHVR